MSNDIRHLGDIRISLSVQNDNGVPYVLHSTTAVIEPNIEQPLKDSLAAAASLCNDVVAAIMGNKVSDNLILLVMQYAKQGKVSPRLKKVFCRLFCPMDEATVIDLRDLLNSQPPDQQTPPDMVRGQIDPTDAIQRDEYTIPPEIDEVLKKLFGEDYDDA